MWNGPKDGTDWTTCDFTKPPWVSGCAELTHDEVLFVIENIAPFEEQFGSDTNSIVSGYNNLTGYEKAINGDTYAVIKSYDPTVNTLGIDANGIVQPTEEPTPTEVI